MWKDPNSAHRVTEQICKDLMNRVTEQICKDLMNQSQHLQKGIVHFTKKQIANNRLQLKASIYVV